MVGATVPLARQARRRAALAAGEPSAVDLTAGDDRSPWDDPTRLGAAPAGGRLAVRARPAGPAVAIVAAVTLLEHLHLLAEVSRLGG